MVRRPRSVQAESCSEGCGAGQGVLKRALNAVRQHELPQGWPRSGESAGRRLGGRAAGGRVPAVC